MRTSMRLPLPRRELRRHVGGRAEHALDVASTRNERGKIVTIADRDAPIEKVDLAVAPEHDVAWLQIEVDDAARVCEVDGVADLHESSEVLLSLGAVLKGERPVDALDTLHEQQRCVLTAVQRVYRYYVGVLELAAQPRFTKKRLGRLRIRGVERGFDRDLTTETALLPGSHHPHRTTADLRAEGHERRVVPRHGRKLLHPVQPRGGGLRSVRRNDRARRVDLQLGRPDPALVPYGVELRYSLVDIHFGSRASEQSDRRHP